MYRVHTKMCTKLVNLFFRLLCVLVLFCTSIVATWANEWLAVTEEFPPYSYSQFNEPKGYATELVKELARRANISIAFEILPWSRAMLIANSTPRTLIYSMLRTQERESEYHWIGEIDDMSLHVWQIEQNASLLDIAHDRITYGAIRSLDEHALEILKSQMGIAEDKIVLVSKAEQLLQLLLKGRVDRIVMAENMYKKLMAKNKASALPPLTSYLRLNTQELFLAASKQTTLEEIIKLQRIFEEMTAELDLQALRKKYKMDD